MSMLAEQNVIGSLLLDSESIGKIQDLEPDMFGSELYGRMYLEFLRGYEAGYQVNAVVLAAKITDFPADMVQKEIRTCLENTIASVGVESYADIVIREYRAARLNRILQSVKPDPESVDEQIGRLINDMEALLDNRENQSKTLAEITQENKDKYFRDNEAQRMYIGFPKLDDLLGGLEGGDMIVIGARPGVGKSAFVTQVTTSLARSGKRVGFYNLEMQEKQVYERFVVAESGIGLTRLRRAVRFLGDEEERFRRANEVLEKEEQIIITTGSKSVSEIRNESRHMGYDIIVIDYLQLLKSDRTYRGNRYAEVGAISKAIKALAMELNIPIIALSQLNRVSEARENKEPTMAELREAGDIEQDASVILLMWNTAKNDSSRKGIKVEKQRQGRTGKLVFRFRGDLMKFEETDEAPGTDCQEDENPFI
ncbi:MAG TPA: AAA family ATPase [Candidatus Merdisoma merdipullorum]|nr:AAA family ATPase [Candidatus Merdisoma merdipullorum]